MDILLAFVTLPKEATIFKHSDSDLEKQGGRNAKPWFPVHSCAWAMANTGQRLHMWKTIDDSTELSLNSTAGQKALSAAIHFSRFCYNRMSRGGDQKSLNLLNTEKKK